MTVPRPGIEESVTAKQRRLVAMSQQADMRHGVPRRVETLELQRASDPDHVALLQAAIDTPDPTCRARVGQHLGAGGPHQALVASRMVEVLVRVEDLGNGPALLPRHIQTQLPLQRIHRQGFAGLGTGNQVVKVSVGISRPDALYQHNRCFRCDSVATYPESVRHAIMHGLGGPYDPYVFVRARGLDRVGNILAWRRWRAHGSPGTHRDRPRR